MKRKLFTGIAVAGLALAVGWAAFAQGMPGYGGGYGPGYGPMMGGYGQMHQGYGPMMGGYGPMGGGYGYGPMHRGYGPDGTPCPAYGDREPLTQEKAKEIVEWRLERHGNTLLEVGKVTETDDGRIVVDVVTKDGGKLADQVEFAKQAGGFGRGHWNWHRR